MPELDGLLRLVAGLLVLLVVFAGLRRDPKVALVAWLLVVCFVPTWVGVTVSAYFPAFVVAGLLAAVSLLPAAALVRWSLADLLLLAVGVIAVVELALGLTTRSGTFDLVTSWGAAYVLGRVLVTVLDARWVYGAVGACFTVVAALALAEAATGTNLFTSYLATNSGAYDLWGVLQYRGGLLRVEGAFGHSIALGSSLGVAVALTLASRFRPAVRTAMVLVMAAAAVLTFSRTGMATVAAAIVLSCLFLRGPLTRRYRVVLLAVTVVAATVAFSVVSGTFSASGNEAEGSALYRADLLQLVGYVNPFGLAENFSVSTTQVVTVGQFGSVDNALLLFGLVFGWVPGAVVVLLLLTALGTVLLRRATPAVVAVVAQLPALVTVALITQYAAVLWFAVGLAVGTQVAANRAARARRATAAATVAPERELVAADR